MSPDSTINRLADLLGNDSAAVQFPDKRRTAEPQELTFPPTEEGAGWQKSLDCLGLMESPTWTTGPWTEGTPVFPKFGKL